MNPEVLTSPDPRRWMVLAIVASGLFLICVDLTVLYVALPALTATLVVNLGFGAISRSAPSMNLFAVGFPITICLGLLAVWLALRALPGAFDSLQTDAWNTMRQLIGR